VKLNIGELLIEWSSVYVDQKAPRLHSWRNAISGSTRVAQRAGSHVGSSATVVSTVATMTNVSGSEIPVTTASPPLPGEVGRERRQHEQAGVAGVERLIAATKLKTEQCRHLDGHGRGDGKAQDDERLGARGVPRLSGSFGSDDQLLP
jgi:hypothetical protein